MLLRKHHEEKTPPGNVIDLLPVEHGLDGLKSGMSGMSWQLLKTQGSYAGHSR